MRWSSYCRVRMLLCGLATLAICAGGSSTAQVDICQIKPNHPSCGGGGAGSAALTRPESYDDFQVVQAAEDLDDLILATPRVPTYLYLPEATDYVVDNPILIDRTTTLYIHGADKLWTRLVAQDPTQPLFIVTEGSRINIAGLTLLPIGPDTDPQGAVCISLQNNPPIELEVMESLIDRCTIEISGPGSYRFQNVNFTSQAIVPSTLIINHVDADVLIVGGNMKSGVDPIGMGSEFCLNGLCEIYHVWQKDGRLRLYGTAVQFANGNADFRIETASNLGPHAIVNVRSEGVKCTTEQPSSFVFVPPAENGDPSDEAVDLVMMNNAGGWKHPTCTTPGDSHFIDYNAAGTVWLLGNTSFVGAGRLAIGNPDDGARIVALGNRYFGNPDDGEPLNMLPIGISPGNAYTAGNLWAHKQYCEQECPQSLGQCQGTGTPCTTSQDCASPHICIPLGHCQNAGTPCTTPLDCPGPGIDTCVLCDIEECDLASVPPVARFVELTEPAEIDPDAPHLPELTVPLPLERPPVASPLQGMVDAGVCLAGLCEEDDFPSGCETDYTDRCAIQTAFNIAIENKRPVYIPQGQYELDETLYFIHGAQADDLDVVLDQTILGGWIAGQNDDVTLRGPSLETVFATGGMASGTIQGITFETDPWQAGRHGSTVEFENPQNLGHQQQDNTFHRCSFVGGRRALGINMDSSEQGDSNLIVNGSFRDAYYGLGVGGANAMNNIVYKGAFENNYVTMGHDPDEGLISQQGSWSVLHATISGTKEKEIELTSSGDKSWYFYGVTSDTQKLLEETETGGVPFAMVFDHYNMTCERGCADPFVTFSRTNGPLFLASRMQWTSEVFGICETSGESCTSAQDCVSSDACIPMGHCQNAGTPCTTPLDCPDPGIDTCVPVYLDIGHLPAQPIELLPRNSAKYAFKLASHIPGWFPVGDGGPTPDLSRDYEWLATAECPVAFCSPGCKVSNQCVEDWLTVGEENVAACVVGNASGTSATICPQPETIRVRTCDCKSPCGGQSTSVWCESP